MDMFKTITGDYISSNVNERKCIILMALASKRYFYTYNLLICFSPCWY